MTQQQQNWDRFRNRWVCDGVIYEIDTLYLRGSSIFRPINGDDLGDNVEMKTKWGFFIQSTGLKDKNGKLIYEGDILKYAVQVPDDCYIGYFKIEYNINKCCFYAISLEDKKYDFMFSNDATQDMEIIGNIHTHPELLTSIEKGEEIHL